MTFKIKDNLWVGDMLDAKNLERDFDRVINLSHERVESTDFHHPLDDGHNEFVEYENAVLRVLDSYTSGQKTFVHCDAGISRSPSVIASAMAIDEGRDYDDCVTEIRNVYPIALPEPELDEVAKKVVQNDRPE